VDQFSETEQSCDSKSNTEQKTEQAGVFGFPRQVAFGTDKGSANETLDRPKQFVVGGVRVDAGRYHRFVARELLGEPKVLRLSVNSAACRMAKRMQAQVTLESSALLPKPEGVSKLARGKTSSEATYENGRCSRDGLARPLAIREEFFELGTHDIGQKHLLRRWLLCGPLEHPQHQAPFGSPCVIENVADIEGQHLMLTQPCSHRKTEDDVVSKAVDALARDLEQGALLGLGQGFYGAGDGVGIDSHGESPCNPYRLPFVRKARPVEVSRAV
jgi:hypothetical protein